MRNLRRKNSSGVRIWLAVGASYLALHAAAAVAQTAPVDEPSAAPSTSAEPDDTLPSEAEADTAGEIVVTARKQGERLQDVPISVNAVSGDQLRDRGAADVKDVLRAIPGLSFSGTERGQSNYNIRGISTVAASPTVGIYLDDISLITVASNFSGGFDPVFFDMERLEVLKGPQGTLYGGSAMGGAIKYVSAKPNLSRFGVDAAAGIATTKSGALTYNGELVVNLPVVEDKLAVRMGVFYRHDGGYVDNGPGELVNSGYSSTPSPTYTPRVQDSLSTRVDDNHNDGKTYALRLSAVWQPDSNWSIQPMIFYQDYRLGNPGTFFPNQARLRSSWRLSQPTHDKGGIYSLNIEKDLGTVRLTSLTAYFDRDLSYARDYSYFVPNLLGPASYNFVYQNADIPNLSISRTKTFSQELRIGSTDPRGALRWTAGLYFSDQKDGLQQTVTIPGFAPILGTEEAYFGDTRTATKQYAIFGEVTLRLIDNLDLIGGMRVFKIDQSVDILARGPLATPANVTGRKSGESGVNPKVGLSYKVAPDNLLYASATKGFRPGGPNRQFVPTSLCAADLSALGRTTAPETFDADNVWSYEIGTKNKFAGNRATVNAAAFYTDWSKIQQRVSLPGCGFEFTANAGSAKVKGAEIESRYNLTDELQIGGTATYTDATLKETVPGTPAQAGDRTLAVPKWMATAFVSYSTDVDDTWRFNLRGEYQYQGRARRDFNRTRPFVYPGGTRGIAPNAAEFREAFDVVNASASLADGTTEIRLFANNLFDARPIVDYVVNGGSDFATTIRPRTFGIELRRHF